MIENMELNAYATAYAEEPVKQQGNNNTKARKYFHYVRNRFVKILEISYVEYAR